ncbi:MAG: DUF177 domain-containing protein [Methyloceanibacter sp.]|nr:DUF177 domain-containing protein [Methyloceanibacter sp.]
MTQSLNEDLQPSPLTRKVQLAGVERGADKSIEINEDERSAIMELLDLVDLGAVEFVYRLREGRGQRVHLTGRLRADVVQTCVVSLEPVPAVIDVPVEAEFWPPEKIAVLHERAEDPAQVGEADWPEPISGDAIDLGPLVYETLATALDPYPKKTGAQFDWTDAKQGAETPKNNPFAALKDLKKS